MKRIAHWIHANTWLDDGTLEKNRVYYYNFVIKNDNGRWFLHSYEIKPNDKKPVRVLYSVYGRTGKHDCIKHYMHDYNDEFHRIYYENLEDDFRDLIIKIML